MNHEECEKKCSKAYEMMLRTGYPRNVSLWRYFLCTKKCIKTVNPTFTEFT